MNESQISIRYAKALFLSAEEKNLLEDVYRDMELLSRTCQQEDFQYMLVLPALAPSQKIKVMDSIFGKHFCPVSISMVNLVIKNKRELYLPGIARNFMDHYRKHKGIRSALLVTATEVDQKILEEVKQLIAETFQSEVELAPKINEDVIGGFVLTVEGLRYDASVASNLRKIKKQLLQTTTENK
jgi:F-type H+-transporting ATPase subunit delta